MRLFRLHKWKKKFVNKIKLKLILWLTNEGYQCPLDDRCYQYHIEDYEPDHEDYRSDLD